VSISALKVTRLPSYAKAELRASHAGEAGAVWIYRGVLVGNWLAMWRKPDTDLVTFARHHLETEKQHLGEFENRIHWFRGSVFLLLWLIAGFITGLIPALLGKNWVYYTIFKVESFVDQHYSNQIALLSQGNSEAEKDLTTLFKACNQDEVAHKNEALNAMTRKPSRAMSLWGKLVEYGSGVAVAIAKKL